MPLFATLYLATVAAQTVAPATPGEVELHRVIGTRQEGKPVACISPQDQTTVQVIDGTAIIYGFGARLYVNRPTSGANALRRDDLLATNSFNGQLCRLDTVTLVDPPSPLPRATVTLGAFVPYNRAD